MTAGAARVVRLAGANRTARRNRWLAAVLTLVAGTLNSVGFVAVSVYTSHMTGITASIADHLVLGSLALVVIGVEARMGISVSESDEVTVSSTSGDGVLPFGK